VKHPCLLFIFSFFFLNFSSEAQQLQLTESAEVSILTIGPGPNLYDKFGHCAFRIKDEANQIDTAYNYGVFDFNTPNFYTKFAQGKLLYKLDTESAAPFLARYVRQNRWVKEQLLNLSLSEKQALFQFLENNALPQNRDYLYDFFYDNCATRMRDVLTAVLADKLHYPNDYLEETKTFRELIQQNVPANSWGSLGMDVAIGAVTDVKATPWEHQYLPEYVFQAAKSASLSRNGQKIPLIKESHFLFENSPKKEKTSFYMSPLFIFGLLGLLIIGITIKDFRNKSRSRFLDAVVFFVTGIIGVVLLLLWFATDHSSTVNNYNLLWAFPFSILFTFAIGKKQPKKWLRRYVLFLIILLVLLTLHSITGVQKFAIGLIPLFVALGVRYVYLVSFLKKQ